MAGVLYCIIQEYIFSFSYGEHGVALEVAAGAKGKKKQTEKFCAKKAPGANVNSVRYQVVRLMRMLVQICQTLEKVPTEVSDARFLPTGRHSCIHVMQPVDTWVSLQWSLFENASSGCT